MRVEPFERPVFCKGNRILAHVEASQISAQLNVILTAIRTIDADPRVCHVFPVGPARCRVDMESG